jgi:hypothetical protein
MLRPIVTAFLEETGRKLSLPTDPRWSSATFYTYIQNHRTMLRVHASKLERSMFHRIEFNVALYSKSLMSIVLKI